jgi:hypothetical protein
MFPFPDPETTSPAEPPRMDPVTQLERALLRGTTCAASRPVLARYLGRISPDRVVREVGGIFRAVRLASGEGRAELYLVQGRELVEVSPLEHGTVRVHRLGFEAAAGRFTELPRFVVLQREAAGEPAGEFGYADLRTGEQWWEDEGATAFTEAAALARVAALNGNPEAVQQRLEIEAACARAVQEERERARRRVEAIEAEARERIAALERERDERIRALGL